MCEQLSASLPSASALFRCCQGLDSPITEYGANLSMGERQLLCLARVLIQPAGCVLVYRFMHRVQQLFVDDPRFRRLCGLLVSSPFPQCVRVR